MRVSTRFHAQATLLPRALDRVCEEDAELSHKTSCVTPHTAAGFRLGGWPRTLKGSATPDIAPSERRHSRALDSTLQKAKCRASDVRSETWTGGGPADRVFVRTKFESLDQLCGGALCCVHLFIFFFVPVVGSLLPFAVVRRARDQGDQPRWLASISWTPQVLSFFDLALRLSRGRPNQEICCVSRPLAVASRTDVLEEAELLAPQLMTRSSRNLVRTQPLLCTRARQPHEHEQHEGSLNKVCWSAYVSWIFVGAHYLAACGLVHARNRYCVSR